MVDFKTLKKNSGQKSLETLSAELDKLNKNESNDDERYWQPTVDKAGNGYAVIRFLDAPPSETVPYIRMWDHGFEGPGGWYIENSLTTLGKDDPVSEYNTKLWNTGLESQKDIARKQKRRLHFHSNILVISDPGKPECEGKNYLFAYGKKIFDKTNDLMHPQFPGDVAVNPFDFWAGADFIMKIRKIEGYRNYDKSEFKTPSALFDGDDEKIEALYNKLYSLKEIIAPKHFKSYDDLKARLAKVLASSNNSDEEKLPEAPAPKQKEKAAPSYSEAKVDDDDDSLEFFKNLAK